MAFTAIFTGASALNANERYLSIIGNNLANFNTSGFKVQRPRFADLFYQTFSAGSAPQGNLGSTDPIQIGFGVEIASVSTLMEQAPLTPTGQALDLAMQGTGFFVAASGANTAYTRAGSFEVDSVGFLIDPNTGYRIQRFGDVGEGVNGDPAFQVAGDGRIRIPYGAQVPGVTTSEVVLRGNLGSALGVGESASTAIQVFDTQFTSRALNITFTKTGVNTFDIGASINGGTVTPAATQVTFDSDGLLVGPDSVVLTLAGLPGPQTITLQLGVPGQPTGLTQFGGPTTASAVNQDGISSGTLNDVSVDQNGIIQGLVSNGRIVSLAQVAVARFNNQNGLLREGENYFSASPASGEALIGSAGEGGRGFVQGGSLEESNVNVALEFSRLILAQRSYQINARVISIGSDVLQDLTNVLR